MTLHAPFFTCCPLEFAGCTGGGTLYPTMWPMYVLLPIISYGFSDMILIICNNTEGDAFLLSVYRLPFHHVCLWQTKITAGACVMMMAIMANTLAMEERTS